MTTDNEHRLFGHLLRLTSALVLIELAHEQGQPVVALEAQLAAARRYLMTHCPSLLLFTELCYRRQAIPDGLSHQAEQEAVHGHHAGV